MITVASEDSTTCSSWRSVEFDVFTVRHSLQVSLFATYVAKAMGAPLVQFGAASMFHDVGKGRIPDEVLYKPGRLDDDERRVMSMHPRTAPRSCSTARTLAPAPDGRGLRLPALRWPGLPRTSSLVRVDPGHVLIQICDVFEALTSAPLQGPVLPGRAFQILLDPGAFDPTLPGGVHRGPGPLYPPGRFVLLTDGRLGVVRAGRALDHPVVRTFPGERCSCSAPPSTSPWTACSRSRSSCSS